MSAPRHRRADSFQRLEFLGDRVLGPRRRRHADAQLSGRARRRIVPASGDARAARDLRRGRGRMGRRALRAAGRERGAGRAARPRRRFSSDVCESLIGAVYLDGGFAAARGARRARVRRPRWRRASGPCGTPRRRLQEWAQARGLGTPAYHAVERAGPDHAPAFTIAVQVGDRPAAEGRGGSKRVAEQAAARSLSGARRRAGGNGLMNRPHPVGDADERDARRAAVSSR